MYLGDQVQGAALGVAVADAHASNRDVLDGVVILRGDRKSTVSQHQQLPVCLSVCSLPSQATHTALERHRRQKRLTLRVTMGSMSRGSCVLKVMRSAFSVLIRWSRRRM